MGLLVPALVGIGILVVMVRRRPPLGRAIGTRSVVYGAIAIVILSPWYVRNAIETGDPMHPFGRDASSAARNWSAEAAATSTRTTPSTATTRGGRARRQAVRGLWRCVKFPWDLTMHPESFENGKRQGQDVSPFVFAFLPALLLVRRRRRTPAIAVAAIGIAYGAIIAVGAWAHPRYVLPGTALVDRRARPPARRRSAAGASSAVVVALTVAGNVALTTRLFRPMWPDQVRVAFGRLAPSTFLGRYSDRWVFWHQANDAVPETGRVAVLEKIPHPYYIDRPFVLLSLSRAGPGRLPRRCNTARRRAAPHARASARPTSPSTWTGSAPPPIRSRHG